MTFLFCVMAYLLGSLSSAVIVCRLAGLPDPRTTGSKNPGATNVLRVGGKRLAALTLLGDVLKGVIAVQLAMVYSSEPNLVGPVILAVFLGHLYPIFFDFQGGKGVATALGALFILSPAVGSLFVVTWLIMMAFLQISSLAALTAAFLTPFYVFWLKGADFSLYIACMSAILFWRHRVNIKRLIRGEELKISIFSKIRS